MLSNYWLVHTLATGPAVSRCSCKPVQPGYLHESAKALCSHGLFRSQRYEDPILDLRHVSSWFWPALLPRTYSAHNQHKNIHDPRNSQVHRVEMSHTQVAILPVKEWLPDQKRFADGPPAVSVTFYKVQGNTGVLHFISPGLSTLGTIIPQTWTQSKSWYIWQGNTVAWGTIQGDQWQSQMPILDTTITFTGLPPIPSAPIGSTTTNSVAQSLDSSTALAAAGSTSLATAPLETSPASSASSKPKPNHKGVSSGAVAGVAIGCLIAGALITGILFWFCWGRRRTSQKRDYETSSAALVPQEKGFVTNSTSVGDSSPATAPISFTAPLPLEDNTISGEISKISNSIKNHVQSYYHTGRVSPELLDLDDIQAIGTNLPVPVGTLSTLLGNSTTREIALRFCIAWVVCSRIKPDVDPRTSLLPVEIAKCFEKIANAQRGSTKHTPLAPRWRVMTAELLQSSYIRDPFNASDNRNGSIQAALDALDNILQPYADSRMDNGQRRRNLEEIIKRSALFAFKLFSQPSTWDFDWKEDQDVKSGELCIFPALVQLSDEAFQPVSPPRPFSEAVVRRLNS
ncbi:hypothetical protein GQ44DRAFT_670571 [Phaeosphaeriaceae sp. PMI808]|nr:hypothetical protein GQ44DRAFT_670571 [Phaeosphaeriaceae sp. PMI808]